MIASHGSVRYGRCSVWPIAARVSRAPKPNAGPPRNPHRYPPAHHRSAAIGGGTPNVNRVALLLRKLQNVHCVVFCFFLIFAEVFNLSCMKSAIKVCLLVLISVSSFLSVVAQNESKWKDLSFLKDYKRILLKVDFSDAMVNYLSVDEFKSEEPDWDDGVQDMIRRMTAAFNAVVFSGPNALRLVSQGEAPVTMTVKVLQLTSTHVSRSTTSMSVVIIISDMQNNELFRKRMNVEKGVYGSKLNLFGDAFERLGDSLGWKFVNYIR